MSVKFSFNNEQDPKQRVDMVLTRILGKDQTLTIRVIVVMIVQKREVKNQPKNVCLM